jgi:TRAP-type C4-dicarboxylate transport system permease small subunit
MNKHIESYSSICQIIATGLRYLAFLAVVLIVLSLGAQVCFRYLLQLPLEHTDELAQTSLVWLTFIGAAALYHERGHITVDCLSNLFSEQISRYLAITVEITIAFILCLIIGQIFETQSVMQRVTYGTLGFSKFTLHFLPLLISCLATVLFNIEAILFLLRIGGTTNNRRFI